MEDTSVYQTSVKKIRLDNVDTEGNYVNNGVTYFEVDAVCRRLHCILYIIIIIIQWAGV